MGHGLVCHLGKVGGAPASGVSDLGLVVDSDPHHPNGVMHIRPFILTQIQVIWVRAPERAVRGVQSMLFI